MEITTHVLTSKQTLSTDQQHQARKNVQAVGAVKVDGSTTISPDPNNNDIVDLSGAFDTIQNAIENVRQVPTVQSSDNGKVLGVTDANGSIGWVESQVASQVNADWTATEGVAEILHKPDLSVYAQAADLSSVATSGSYNDLEDKPDLAGYAVKSEMSVTAGSGADVDKTTIQLKSGISATVLTTHQDVTGKADKVANATVGNLASLDSNGNLSDSGVASANLVHDGSYVHTDNNYTNADKTKLEGIASGAEVNIQSDWNQTDDTADDFIKNKPEIPAAQVKADWNASGTVAEILNKPTIPTVDQAFDATSTNAQSGVAVSGAVSGKYEKPSGGIPATDLESAVQTSLGKSDSAIQGVKVNHSLLTPDADKVVDVVVDEVPTVTSTDNGKVLKASYNNGVASYAWQSEGGGSQSVVDQHYSASSTNAQSGTAVAEAIGTVRQVPSTQSSDENKVLGVTDANGTLGWVTPAASQVNADWNATSGAAEILNKPSLAAVATSGAYSDLSGTPDLSNYVTDASYVHTDNNYTNADKNKLAGIAAGAEVNVQSDWNQTDDTADDFIKNKPTIPSFNQTQMDAIDSGITSAKVDGYDRHVSDTDVHVTTSDKTAWNAKYDKPSGGIPKADMADAVQTSLGKADTALQEHQDISGKADKSEMSVVAGTGTNADKTTITLKSGTSATVLTSHQDISGKQDVISDLSDIRSGASAGATAVQPGDLATVATSGSYSDLSNKPTIPAAQVNSDWNASSGVAEILNKPSLSAVATSGSYTDLTDTPSIPAAQVNSDWDASSGVAQILNKPSLATVATSGDYDDLTNKPLIPDAQVNSDWNASSGVAEILNKPTLATVATSGDYDDLTNKPSIPAAQVNSDWDAFSGVAQILNKPTLAAVATSGSYNDLSNKPTIPAAQVQSDWEQDDSSEVDYIKNKPSLASVATSGSYNDLTNKPTIPAAQVNSDWNASSGVAEILNKPSIPSVDQSYGSSSTNAQSGTAVAEAIGTVRQVPSTQSSDNGKVLGVTDTSGSLGWVDQPADELPSITGNGGKVLKVNAGATAVEWDDETDTTYESKTAAESGTDVSLVTTGEKYTWDHKQDALSFDGTYTASSNKVATESTVSSAVQALDAEVTSSDGTNVQVKVTEANGKVTAVNITTDNTESKSNKKQSIDSTSETEYPSSKAVANFVNSSVATATARFLGSFTLTNLGLSYGATNAQIATALDNHTWPSGTTPTNNDYVYVEIQDPQTTGIDDEVRRFKFNGTVWAYEYTLNNSSFTAAEKAAIDSGITATAVSNYNTHIDDTDIHVTSSDKSDWNAKYDLPSGGIPSTDLSSDVQTSLGKADTALQSHQDISGKADKVSGATSGNFAALDGNGNLVDSNSKASDFATSAQGTKADSAIQEIKVNGSSQSPDANKVIDITVPAAQVNSDWNASSGVAEILNKPNLGLYAEKSEMSVTAGTGTDADKTTIQLKTGLTATVLTAHQDISGKQDTISDLQTIREGASAGATAYQKPSGGIPDTDLSSSVQTSLGKADTALQSHQDISGKADKVSGATNGNFAGLDSNGNLTDSGSKAGDFATAAQGGKADTAVQPGDLATVATSGSYTDLSNTPDLSDYVLSSSLATVATSGSYTDLSNTPDIPTVDQTYDGTSANAQSGVAVASVISDKADKVSGATNGNFAGLDSNGNLTDSGSKAGDFATSAQGAKADSAYQKPSGGIPDTDLSSGVQASLGKADTAVQPGNLATVATSGSYTDLSNTPDLSGYALSSSLATVATSGDYNDLDNLPTIPTVDQSYDASSVNAQSGVAVASAISDKADKVSSATNGNFAGLDSNGNLTDSGSKASDFATAAQGAKADSAYQKPSGGIPDTDLSSSVQTSLGKADTALQSHQDISGKADKVSGATNGNFAGLDSSGNLTDSGSKASDFATAAQGTLADSAYQKPSGGIPDTDLSSGVQASLAKADTALQSHQDISGKADKVSGATNGNFAGLDSNGNLTDSGSKAGDFATSAQGAKADSAYQKPSGGIPDTDLSSGVQASLGKADTALQSHQDISGKADKVSGATNGNFAGLDANGNLTDSGSKASDFATAAQGTLADSAYQLPSGGMPSTDMASAVQTSLGKADSAIQGVKVNSTALTPDANHIVDITINNATVTIDMAGTASSPNRSVGSFTVDQSAASTITIPTAVSAIPEVIDQNNEVVTAAVPAQPGVLSSGDKEKLDGLFNVTGSSTIAIDPSTHAVSAIVGPDGGVVAGASGLIVQPDLVSRVVYVGADCVYNDKTFWSDSATVDGIIADYANQTVTDYRGNGVPLARFVAEYDSNRYRIANIDETPGTVEYNRKIGGQIIDLMRSDFWMSSHPTYDIIKFDQDMDKLFDLLMTGSPMNAYLLLNEMTSTAFITDARREMYMDMIKAYDAWPYTDKDTAYADFMAEHALDRFVQVSTSWPLNSWNSYRYVMAGTKTATDKVIFVLRHAERGDDTSVNGDINSTGVTTCTTMGEQVRNNASWSSGGTTYRIDNFPANDATYYSTEYLRCKHSAQAFAEARYDTDFAASDYSGITVEADMLNQYRFFYQPASSGNSDLIRKYSVNPSQLTSSELSNYFGVSSAAEAQEKLSNDYVRVCKEILNKSTARLNMFYTHDFFTLPLAVMASNKYFDFSGNSSADNRNWINYCAGIGMILHPDNTYEVLPVRGKSNGTMTI